jgi:glycosyltransferase involved in cell wall biosynthesis
MTAAALHDAELRCETLSRRLRVLFVLPGLHRVNRGAEVAFESIAAELSHVKGYEVTLIGSGHARPGTGYRFVHAGCVPREKFEAWPTMPLLRSACMYEELSFVASLARVYDPREYDVTVTCGYPYVNWCLRARGNGRRPAHVFVTQNGDWPAHTTGGEFKLFSCDGLVCTNNEYYERHKNRWLCDLIPNGVHPHVFFPGACKRDEFALPRDRPVALMVSALIPSKRVIEGIRAAARVEGLHLLLAGDGPLRSEVDAVGRQLMGGRFRRVVLPRLQMPNLYRSADVFLHMSQDEPFGNVYIEALATGLPIVTQDRCATRWMLEDQGVLVDTSDEDEVVDGLVCALGSGNRQHVAARRRLVERRFSWRAISEQYARFLELVAERVMSRRRGSVA